MARRLPASKITAAPALMVPCRTIFRETLERETPPTSSKVWALPASACAVSARNGLTASAALGRISTSPGSASGHTRARGRWSVVPHARSVAPQQLPRLGGRTPATAGPAPQIVDSGREAAFGDVNVNRDTVTDVMVSCWSGSLRLLRNVVNKRNAGIRLRAEGRAAKWIRAYSG